MSGDDFAAKSEWISAGSVPKTTEGSVFWGYTNRY